MSAAQIQRAEVLALKLGYEIYDVAADFVDYWHAETIKFRKKFTLSSTFTHRLNDLAKYREKEKRAGTTTGHDAIGRGGPFKPEGATHSAFDGIDYTPKRPGRGHDAGGTR